LLLFLLGAWATGRAGGLEYPAGYEKTEHRVAMRDGARLFTAVYRPLDASRRYPILLLRTPYSIEPYGEHAFPEPSELAPGIAFLRAGYIFVLQDARGTHRSGGEWIDFRPLEADRRAAGIDESTDTYDTVEWALRNVRGHNGKVGQWGFSHPGWYAVQGLVGTHPAVKAVSPQATTGDAFIGDDYRLGGAFALTNNVPFMDKLALVTAPDRGERTWGTIRRRLDFNTLWDYEFFLQSGPLAEFNARYYGGRLGKAWDDLVAHSSYDEYWRERNPAMHLADVRVPVLNVGGWFDGYCPYGALSTYRDIEQRNPVNSSTLVFGPWHHGAWLESDAEPAKAFREDIVFPFFERHLKGEGNWEPAEAIVFETGADRWHRLGVWPPKGVSARPLYLRDAGTLTFEAPADAEGAAHDTYVSDPARPVPVSGGFSGADDVPMTEDQRFAFMRPDVLSYRSDVLDTPLTIAGPIQAKLHVATTGTDSDWVVKLIDVRPDGYQMLLAAQLLRGRFRNGLDAPQAMRPGEITPIELTLWDRFHTFGTGHRLMVQVQSSWFPKYDRNPQTYVEISRAGPGDYRRATQTVYRSAQAPSLLVLPVLAVTAVAAPPPHEPLPLRVDRTLSFETDEGTWISLDVAPDGKTLVFDLLGDIYSLEVQGGAATPLLTGLAFESQPVFSPDGSRIAYISDRSGNFALWTVARDGSDPKQITVAPESVYAGPIWGAPAWSPDGESIYVIQSRLWETQIWRYPAGGGPGAQVTGGEMTRDGALDPAPSPDGRHLYYTVSASTKGPWDNTWDLRRRDLGNGLDELVLKSAGGAIRPVLSRDGRHLAYGTRGDGETELRLRNLRTGEDRLLARPIQAAPQPSGDSPITPRGLLPAYDFSADGRAIFIGYGGKIHRVDLESGQSLQVPFHARVNLAVGPSLRRAQKGPTGPVRARVIQAPQESPDGRRLAFSALGRVYVMPLVRGATPKRLTGGDRTEFEPVWSPDGEWIAYVSWSDAEGGHVWKSRSDGSGVPQRLTRHAASYRSPVFGHGGREIFMLLSSARDRVRNEIGEHTMLAPAQQIVAIPAEGGDARVIASAEPAGSESGVSGDPGNLHLAADGTIYFQSGDRVRAVRTDGTHGREVVKVAGPGWLGDPDTPATGIRVSPDGRWALAHLHGGQLYVAPLTTGASGLVVLDIASPSSGLTQLTNTGVDSFDWVDGGRAYAWSVGASYHRRRFEPVRSGSARTEEFAAVVELPRDVPRGTLVLRGATVLTMRGEETIADADIVIEDNRIEAVGPRGRVPVPRGVQVRDVGGRYVTPGFIDTHYHSYYNRRGSLDLHPWEFAMQLAYGVTASLDPSGGTVDSFVYEDLADAGLVLGGRGYTVGPAVGNLTLYRSEAEVRSLLATYRDVYRTRNIKAYLVGNRTKRQWVVNAARELGMMPTTEGAYDMAVDLTHAIDGFFGNEHALPVTPLYRDVIQLYARTDIAYTPTLAGSALKKKALAKFLRDTNAYEDPKVRRFMPRNILEAKAVSLPWQHESQLSHGYPALARGVAAVFRAGGRVGVGSHGNFPGLGYHAELAALASGGLSAHEVLQIATRVSSEVIGREAELGTVEPGKYADLIIFESDPRVRIGNSLTLSQVMKNGRLYDAATLDEVWPRVRRFPRQSRRL
jgi:putative CocE/NonD family hydrolase